MKPRWRLHCPGPKERFGQAVLWSLSGVCGVGSVGDGSVEGKGR